MGLDAAYPKSKRSTTAAQQAAAGLSAEPEAEPFSRPKPSRAKVGPRQQMKAAAEQENSSAAANTKPDARSKGASKPKVPKAPKFEKCGTCHHCTHPNLKQGCIWIKQQKALLVAESTTQMFSDVIASDGLPCVTISVTNLSSESISSATAAGFGGERDSSLRSDANGHQHVNNPQRTCTVHSVTQHTAVTRQTPAAKSHPFGRNTLRPVPVEQPISRTHTSCCWI